MRPPSSGEHEDMPRCLIALFLAPFASAQDRPPAPVHTVPAEIRNVAERELVTGSLRAESEALLAALEEGSVLSIAVREGTVVRRGDELLQLDTRRLEAERAQVLASHAEAVATRTQREAEAQDAHEDVQALEAAGDSIPKRELRRARTAASVADALHEASKRRVEALDAEQALLELRLADATLRAPFDGVVVERHVEIGEWVQVGQDAITLLSAERLEAWLDVPERHLATMRGGEFDVAVTVGEGTDAVPTGALRIVPRVHPRTRRFPVIAPLERSKGLTPGMSVSAWLPVGAPKDVLVVPKNALVYRPSGVSVLVVMGENGPATDTGQDPVVGTAALLPVVVAFELDRDVALAPGAVMPGSLVVVEGNERLFPGTPVAATVDRSPSGGESR